MNATKKLSEYVLLNRINLSELSRNTGLNYANIYNSLLSKNRCRALRADELLKICKALEIDPMSLCE